MNKDEQNQAVKQHLIDEYRDSLLQLKICRNEEEAERLKSNLRDIQALAFQLFGAEFADSLEKENSDN